MTSLKFIFYMNKSTSIMAITSVILEKFNFIAKLGKWYVTSFPIIMRSSNYFFTENLSVLRLSISMPNFITQAEVVPDSLSVGTLNLCEGFFAYFV